MEAASIKFRGQKCFRGDWVGFDEIKPVNLIIGRNNSGKSQLLELVEVMTKEGAAGSHNQWERLWTAQLSEGLIAGVLQQQHNGRYTYRLPGTAAITKELEERLWTWTQKDGAHPLISDAALFDVLLTHMDGPGTKNFVANMAADGRSKTVPLVGRHFRRLASDRDIVAEAPSTPFLGSTGTGATSLVGGYLTRATLPEALVERDVLGALNEVFRPDADFRGLRVQDTTDGQDTPIWEIYLDEERKDQRVALSASGSGLKTVLLILLNLLVIPHHEKQEVKDYVFAIEEPENNLHPALLRRLLAYIEGFAKEHGCTFFITTHSSTALDFFAGSDDAQVVAVEHDGTHASTRTLAMHRDRVQMVRGLGAKPSDLLLANGVLWVEGPSDRIYLNRFIELFTEEGEEPLIEGRHYQCAFYAGALLGHDSFEASGELNLNEEQTADFVRLTRLNHNVAVVCDGDRKEEGETLKPHVLRVQDELEGAEHTFFWATAAKEIENYVPGPVFTEVRRFSNPTAGAMRDPTAFDRFPSKSKAGQYWHDQAKKSGFDKVEIARDAAPLLRRETLETRFDLAERVGALVATIRGWNC